MRAATGGFGQKSRRLDGEVHRRISTPINCIVASIPAAHCADVCDIEFEHNTITGVERSVREIARPSIRRASSSKFHAIIKWAAAEFSLRAIGFRRKSRARPPQLALMCDSFANI